MQIYTKDTKNFFVAANSVTEGLVSETVRKFYFQDGVLFSAVDEERVVVGTDEAETDTFRAFLGAGVAEEVVRALRETGKLAEVKTLFKGGASRREQVEQGLNMLVQLETGQIPEPEGPQRTEKRNEGGTQDTELEAVLRAAYHKELGYKDRPKLIYKPSWY